MAGLATTTMCAACRQEEPPAPDLVCSEALYQSFEDRLPTGDGQGHGPDVGSEEWKSVIEFRLGIRGQPGVPPRDGDAWCRYVDDVIRDRGASAAEKQE